MTSEPTPSGPGPSEPPPPSRLTDDGLPLWRIRHGWRTNVGVSVFLLLIMLATAGYYLLRGHEDFADLGIVLAGVGVSALAIVLVVFGEGTTEVTPADVAIRRFGPPSVLVQRQDVHAVTPVPGPLVETAFLAADGSVLCRRELPGMREDVLAALRAAGWPVVDLRP